MSDKTATKTSAEEAAEAFARDTADHQMTVLHDDGLYRHLRFIRMAEQEDGTRKPTSFYWYFESPRWFPARLHRLTCTHCRGLNRYGRQQLREARRERLRKGAA